MKIKAVIWDLDGTLLDTLCDLAASTNAALEMNGMPLRTIDEVRRFVGNGIRKLMVRAVPGGDENPQFEKAFKDFIDHYGAHSRDNTKPYDGILDLLDNLADKGVKHAIVSNKIDFAVKELNQIYFGSRIGIAVGDDPSRERKRACCHARTGRDGGGDGVCRRFGRRRHDSAQCGHPVLCGQLGI